MAKRSSQPKKNRARRRPDQKGNALVMAAIFMVVSTTLITVGLRLTANASRQASATQANVAEADNAARAGLEDTLNWFIRANAGGTTAGGLRAYQQAYAPGDTPVFNPVYTYIDEPFDPKYNANPKQSDTIDESTGLVNEYGLDKADFLTANLLAHYEVKKQAAPPAAYDPMAVHDISGQRAVSEVNGDGVVWSIVSTGYIYKRLDHTYTGSYQAGVCPQWTVPFDQAPNQVIAKVSVSTEFQKVALNLPSPNVAAYAGAVYCEKVPQVHFANSATKLSGAVTAGTNFAILGMTSNP